MTDEEITKLVDDNMEGVWSGEPGIPKRKAYNVIKQAVKSLQEIIDQQTIVIAQKDAKIYAYEAIIASSNFKAVLPKKGKE